MRPRAKLSVVVWPSTGEFHALHGSGLRCGLCAVLPLRLLQGRKNVLLALASLLLVVCQEIGHGSEYVWMVWVHLA